MTESDYLPDLKTLWLCVCIYTHTHIHPPLWLHICECVCQVIHQIWRLYDSTHVYVCTHIHTSILPSLQKIKKNKNWYVKARSKHRNLENQNSLERKDSYPSQKWQKQANCIKCEKKSSFRESSLSRTKLLDFMLSTQDTKVTMLWSQGIQSLYGTPTSENKQLK